MEFVRRGTMPLIVINSNGLPLRVFELAAIELQYIVPESVGLKLALAVDMVHVRFSYFISTAIKERSRRGV